MSSEFHRVEAAFHAVLERIASESCPTALHAVCGTDDNLRVQVESLLDNHHVAQAFLDFPAVNYVKDELVTLKAEAAETQVWGLQSGAETPLTGVWNPDATRDRQESDESPEFELSSGLPAHLFPGSRLGEYDILELIGCGGMGIVVKAREPRLDREVAIKVMNPLLASDPVARRKFLLEARSAAKVIHPNVVTIHAVQEIGNVSYLVMEYVRGQTLDQRLKDGSLALHEVVKISHQTALGLSAAHKRDIVHRDVKPSNILLVDDDMRVKITDFGLARVVAQGTQTQSGTVVGTPRYMSPEQALGDPVDHRSDLFSLGSVMYELCTGRPPFQADSVMAVIRKVSDATHAPIEQSNSEIPAWLRSIINRLLEKRPENRIQTAAEVAALLERGLSGVLDPEPNNAIPMSDAVPKGTRRRTTVLGLIAVLVMAAVFLIRTPDGEFEITTDDPKVAALLGENGGIVVEDRQTNQKYMLKRGKNRLPSGDYELVVTTPAALDLNTPKFRISRAGHAVASIIVRAPATVERPASDVARMNRDSGSIRTDLPKPEVVDTTNQWGSPENLGQVNSAGYDAGPYVSADGLTLMFQTNRNRAQSQGPVQLWQALRTSTNAPFGEPERLDDTVNGEFVTVDPSLSGDGLLMVFGSERPNGEGHADLWMSTRQSTESAWGSPVNLGASVNSAWSDWEPEISRDGLTLCFHSDRTEGFGGTDLWMSSRESRDVPFGRTENMGSGVNGPGNEGGAALSADARTLLFHRVTQNDRSLWCATRGSTAAPFDEAERVKIENAGDGQPVSPALADDGGTLYFNMFRPDGRGSVDLWQAHRTSTAVALPANYALEFDGVTSHVTVPTLSRNEASSATIEAWIWTAEWIEVPKAIFVVGGRSRMQLAIAPGNWFATDDSLEISDIGSRETSRATLQKWTHVAYAADDQTFRLFVDGIEVVSGPRTAKNVLEKALVERTWFGGHPPEADPNSMVRYCFCGRIDEARLSRGVRYNKKFVPALRWEPDSDTLALYHFDEATGNELKDSSGNGHHGQIVGAKWIRVKNDTRLPVHLRGLPPELIP